MEKIVVFFVFCFFSFAYHSQVTFEWNSNLKLDNIQLPGGRHLFYQQCLADQDSLIYNGRMVHNHANYSTLKDFVYIQNVHDTIYTSVEIWFKGRANEDKVNFILNEFDPNYLKSNSTLKSSANVYQFLNGGHRYFAFVSYDSKKYTKIIIVRSN